MKIAVIDHIGNPGGGSRVTRALLVAMRKVRPDWDITFFGNPHSIKRERLEQDIAPHGIKIHPLSSTKLNGRDIFNIRGSRHVVNLFQRKWGDSLFSFSHYLSGAIDRELEAVVKGFDVAFFTWPFHLKCPRLECPMLGIFHDFSFKYFFSAQTMVPWVLDFLNAQMPIWLANSTPIVSTDFMQTELAKFYPEFGHKTRVVPVAPTSTLSTITVEDAKKIIQTRFKLSRKYILCPTHVTSHKNIGSLIAAFTLLKNKAPDVDLVFVGSGTEVINGKSCPTGVELGMTPQDVYGLGYVSNDEIDALIQSASLVANASLYEGGNVPGFDAWARGVPVAMSNIPTFAEHLKVHDVRAQLFDPRSPEDIAEKLLAILLNPVQAQEDIAHSKKAIAEFTWERAAEGYLRICEQALALNA